MRRGFAQTVDPVGVGAMVDLETLPVLRTHTLARQVSSHDPTGGNDDGFFSVNFRYFDKPRKEYVLLEESGPGCIYRIQMADLRSFFGPPVRIHIYLDGAARPQVDLTLADFFSGKQAPFLAPLVGASHPEVSPGFGYYAYVPIPFRTGVRVALTGLVHFYNITYHRYRAGIGNVPAFGKDRSVSEVIGLWGRAGTRPTPARPGERTVRKPVNVAAGGATTLLDTTGRGVVAAVELTPPKPSGPGSVDLDRVRVTMFWDGETTPSVDAPLSLFFATGPRPTRVRGLLIGSVPGQRLYCYFPMPFWRRARIVLANDTTGAIATTATVVYRTTGTPLFDPARTGTFRCTVRTEDPVQPGRDFTALSVGGRGHVVGIALDMAGKDFFAFENYLEGDDRITIDFRKTPDFHGNGTEDFFNGAYYFLGRTFSRPVHGSPFHQVTPAASRRLAYRLFTGDALPFGAHLRIGFEAGGFSHLRARYRAAVFHYRRPEPALVEADRLDLGNAAEEVSHGFSTTGRRVGPTTGAYEGDQDDGQRPDRGAELAPGRWCAFRVAVPAGNDGVLLRRRLDYYNGGVGHQTVRVEVNGRTAGTWRVPGHYLNHLASFPSLPASRGQGRPDKRWLDSDFLIPASLTRGRTRLGVKLINTGAGAWNAYDFRVLAQVATPAPDRQAPGKPGAVQAAGQTTDTVVLTWAEATDNVGIDHYEIWRAASPAHPAVKVGEAFGPRFVDRHVDPGVPVYTYRVRAVDPAGNAGAFAAPAAGSPGHVLHFECEELLPALHSPGDAAGQLDLVLFPQFGRPWSGDNQVLFVGNHYGDWIAFPVTVTVAGPYELKLAFTSFVGTSSFTVLIDGEPAGPPVHHPLRLERREVRFAPRFLLPGVHTITVRLLEGPAVYSGTQVALDCLTLTPR